MTSDRTRRAIDALTAAWPPLAEDLVYAEQVVLVVLHAAGDPQHLPDRDTAELPRWLVDAIGTLPAEQAKPTCTCPMIDVTNIREGGEGIRTLVQGLDPACPTCVRANAEQDGDGR